MGDKRWRGTIHDMVQVAPFSVKEVGGALVPFHVPLKPGSEEGDNPAGIDALYETLVIVTALPLWV